jgi:YidC/Oxa1 family membrane protein insertase
MEKRAIIAALLMAGLLIVYQTLFVQAPESPPPPAQTSSAKKSETPAPKATPPLVPQGQQPLGGIPNPMPAPSVPERTAVVETPLYRAAVSSRGGTISTWDVHFHGDRPMVLPGILGSGGLRTVGPDRPNDFVQFRISTQSLVLGPQAPVGDLELVGEDGFGLRITYTLRFRHDSYLVQQHVKIENRQKLPQGAELKMTWTAPVEWPKEQEHFGGPRPLHVVRLNEGAFWPYRSALSEDLKFPGVGKWVGFESAIQQGGLLGQAGTYLVAFVPQSPGLRVFEIKEEEPGTVPAKPKKRVEIGLLLTVSALGAGEAWDGQLETYMGPMEFEKMKALGVGLEKAIYFGGFPIPESKARDWGLPTLPMEWITVPILWFLRWLYRQIPNYGVAIILLTVISKVLFFPLTLKSMRSMKAMQALQPQINALRSKYKNDSQRVQRETMELYRENRVNPLGGCLPMIVQIPVFYALYVALSVAVEMQSAPFICFGRFFGMNLWICDLAAPDPTYVLPILMGVSMLIQQKMTPTMGDPRQAKMMLIMPVIFTFMFLNLPSGLVLYWTLSNVLQIAQQLYMERGSSAQRTTGRVANKKA